MKSIFTAIATALSVAISLVLCEAKPPHILLVVVDDLGWSDVGYQNISPIKTPNIDELASQGVILDNYYVQPICTPTRSALMSGKYPIHTGMQHWVIFESQPFGLPTDLTILPQQLKKAGYATHMVGKWHLGHHEWKYTPTYRGFDTFYGFYNAGEDYYTHKRNGILDLRDQTSPVRDMDGVYSTDMYTKRVEDIINNHNASTPLFLYLPFQHVHSPNQAPESFVKQYDFIKDKTRRIYAGMVTAVDQAIGKVTKAFKNKGIWNETLLVLTTDNGGIPMAGGYNWPLRGYKATLWEGGVRGVAFVHGAMIEKKSRKCKGLLHVTDWFPTLSVIAGVDMPDDNGSIDGFNVWDTISKDAPSPRTEILHNIDISTDTDNIPFTYNGVALRAGDMKLLMHVGNYPSLKPPELGGDNRKEVQQMLSTFQNYRKSGIIPTINDVIKEALFNITADPEERHDLSAKYPDVVTKLKQRVEFYKQGVVPKLNKPFDPEGAAAAKRNGVWGPWKDGSGSEARIEL